MLFRSSSRSGTLLYSFVLFVRRDRKDTREESTGREMPRGHRAIIRNASKHFESAGNFLRMISLDAAARRKIWRATEHKIEFLIVAQHAAFTKIAETDFIAVGDPIPLRRFAREPARSVRRSVC